MDRPGPPRHLFLIRLAPEITTKARRTRRRFQERLTRNISDALRSGGYEATVENRWTRILVRSSDPTAGERLSSVFGISSVSRIEGEVTAELPKIVAAGAELFKDRVLGRRYAVECRRTGRQPFSSRDVKVELGAALNEGAQVDLGNPEITVEVEVRDDEAYLFSGRIPGPGGLPLGVQGTAVCLISGGFDSAVAAWMMLKRGVRLEYLFCNLAGAAYERSVALVTRILVDEWSHGDWPRLHVVDFEEVVEGIRSSVAPRYWQVVLKRLMYEAASSVATEFRAEAIVTGESLGQVSSQTLGNLRAIDDAAELPVFRPLLGFDKTEIIAQAERIGTAALSARIQEYCAILPTRPVTHSKPAAARDEASKVDRELLTRALAGAHTLDIRALGAQELVEPYIFTEEVPPHARVLDCRPTGHYQHWHYPGAERWDPGQLLRELSRLDKADHHVLYCDQGVQTAHIAEIMQRVGFEAYSFRGGTGALRRYAASRVAGAEAPTPRGAQRSPA